MRRGGKIGLAVAAIGVLAVGGSVWTLREMESRQRTRIDARLVEMGLAEAVRYDRLALNPFTSGFALSGLTFSEDGAVVWRIDRLEVKDFKETADGLPRNAVVAVRGVRLAFAQWAKDCAEKGVSCAYAANADELISQGIDEMLVDADLSYRMDDAAKRLRVAGGLTLQGFVSFGLAATVGGLDSQILRDAGNWMREASRSGVPPALAAAAFGATVGKAIERVELGELGFVMTDLGAVRRRIEAQAKESGDRRPYADILREQVDDVQADIRNGGQPWMGEAFVETMAKALEPFAYEGKPYRISSGERAPVVLIRRGPQGLEAGPDLTDPARLFQAFAPKVDNAPL